MAATLLETDDPRVYQAGAMAKYADGAPDDEQLLHADYANHTLVVPRTDVGYQHLETFVYLSDVTPTTGATRFVDLVHTAGVPVERTYLHLGEYSISTTGGARRADRRARCSSTAPRCSTAASRSPSPVRLAWS